MPKANATNTAIPFDCLVDIENVESDVRGIAEILRALGTGPYEPSQHSITMLAWLLDDQADILARHVSA